MENVAPACGNNCEICLIREQPRASWKALLEGELSQPYLQEILRKLHGGPFFPPAKLVLNALTHFDVADTRVVILGQDPYHGDGQAMGLAFSVPPHMPAPPSLANIKKEIRRSTGKNSSCLRGTLTSWADQGVLLLNTTLTVVKKSPKSHHGLGWHRLTDAIIRAVSENTSNVVFMLWGSDAQTKRGLINRDKHLVLESTHPSPLSAHRGFLGCNHFQLANEYLERHGRRGIKW